MHPDLSPGPAVIAELAAELWRSAAGVLDANWAGDHTVRSRRHHPHQRSLDTAFAAIGLAYVNQRRAWRDLRSLFEAQWPDGRVPHVVFAATSASGTADDDLPGAAFWNVPAYGRRPALGSTGLVQPPLHALAAWEIYRHASAHGAASAQQARTELEWLYPRLVAAQEYCTGRRDAGGAGLAAIVHPWESGPDDSPARDEPLAACDGPGPADRHLELAAAYRDGGYADTDLASRHAFVVECPGFNAVLAAAELALAQIAGVLGQGARARRHREAARRITAAIADRLWNPRTLIFHTRDVRTGTLGPARGVRGLLPLMLPDLPPYQALALMVAAGAGLPAPDHDRAGPVRIELNWLLRRGMLVHGFRDDAERLRREMLRLVHRNGPYERFRPSDGSGSGAADCTGTAALCLDLLTDRSAPAYAHLTGARFTAVQPDRREPAGTVAV